MFGVIAGGDPSYLSEFKITEERIVRTPYGETSSPIWFGHVGSQEGAILLRQGVDGTLLPHQVNYRANVWAMHHLGLDCIISLSAVMAISERAERSTIVLPKDFVDYTKGREATFDDGREKPVCYTKMDTPFDEGKRQILTAMAYGRGVEVNNDIVYGGISGPRLPTLSEIKCYRRDGCDVVGMVGLPEVTLANEIGIPVAILATVIGSANEQGYIEVPNFADYKNHPSMEKMYEMFFEV